MSEFAVEKIKDTKLVIWDLDETFWEGTLSDEGGIKEISQNIEIVKALTDIGIVNSICSKNDRKNVEEILQNIGMGDYFVFNSINWESKGERVKTIISDMGLREQNVLFIDDNHLNIKEVEFFCPSIMTADPNILPVLYDAIKNNEIKKDFSHKRLKQYQILENKKKAKENFCSNNDFLKSCGIIVHIKDNCTEHIERIHELVLRSNQLNFTKLRSSIDDLQEDICNRENTSGTVWVSDRFGDYGMCGFFLVDKNNNLRHFLFSCRTIGMGVEQYVYDCIGRPNINIVGEVASSLDGEIPDWINSSSSYPKEENDCVVADEHSVLIKGPCDMMRIFNFINHNSVIDSEFTYVDVKSGIEIESHNHSMNIVQAYSLSQQDKEEIVGTIPFYPKDFFDTKLFEKRHKIVFLSTLHESHLAMYKHKTKEYFVVFGESEYPLTEPENYSKYIDGEVYNANCKFSMDFLRWFSDNYSFEGRISEEQLCNNIRYILEHIDKNTEMYLLLGSEIPYDGNKNPAYEGVDRINIRNNSALRSLEAEADNLHLIDFSDYIHSQDDFQDNINHFSMQIYYSLAKKITDIINEKNEMNISVVSSKRFDFIRIRSWILHFPFVDKMVRRMLLYVKRKRKMH